MAAAVKTLSTRGLSSGRTALALLAMATGGIAEAAPVERMGAWEVSCDEGAGASRSCRALQRQSVAGTGEPVFAMTVLPAADGRTLVAIVSVPLGGYLAPGIEIAVDARRPFKLLYETCNASGCHAGFALIGKVLADFEKGRQATIRLWTSKNKPVEVSVSLDGFASVLAALKGQKAKAAP